MIADLHIHGKYSRACSKSLSITNLEKYARLKGIDLLGTGDFQHPEWNKELRQNLEFSDGMYWTSGKFPFMLSSEISLIYTDTRSRRVHLILLAPSFEVVDQITEYLLTKGRIDYDGRPIFKISCEDFVASMKNISSLIEVIPAHIWTPYFGVLGSKGGYDSFKEAFGSSMKHIHCYESGLSSDAVMNSRLSSLDKFSMVSFSDSHSFWPWRLGREATLIDGDFNYKSVIKGLHSNPKTVEVDPNYGKYHYDGHAKCDYCSLGEEVCPKCDENLTIGVMNRVNELADRSSCKKNFKTLIPLSDLLSLALGKGVATKTVWNEYNKIVTTNEYDVLLNQSSKDLLKITNSKVVDLIIRNREGKIKVSPGYDGVYGKPIL